eukprot:3069287-Pleurochrysis_carterae.AAC.1
MTRANKLYSVYDKGYVFPTWVVNDFMALMKECGANTKVYFSDPHVQNVEPLVTMQEPVNIGRGTSSD